MNRQRTYLGAHRVRRTWLGVDVREWAVVIPAGLVIALVGYALLVGILSFGAGS